MENNIKLMVIYGDLVMNKEDYFKYYIQGSDHYLIPKDVFIELFNEMESWKQDTNKYKEVKKKKKNILNNQMDYREFVDIVNAIEEVIKEVK